MACNILNQMTELGRPESFAVGHGRERPRGTMRCAQGSMQIERKTRGNVTILAFSGEFDTLELPQVEDKTEAPIREGYTHLVFNLRLLRFIDSSALGYLIKTANRLKEIDGELVISEPSQHVQRTIKMLGIDEILRVVPSDEVAVEYFQEASDEGTSQED